MSQSNKTNTNNKPKYRQLSSFNKQQKGMLKRQLVNGIAHTCINECKYMKHIFELRMKDQIEERSSQLLRNLSSCKKKA